ncbi:MAG TPA: 4-hydroxythreonine-4-phosphate dehydrogenase PdxA [Opitutaceae bacterium]|nr:4-hydroxythreonine-4-phosphate dehydrogenase PdxA [Opitutaceae bacterium]
MPPAGMTMATRLALTCGDPAGIGPEVLTAWLAAQPAEAREVAVLGPARWLAGIETAAEKIAVGAAGFAAIPGQPTLDGAHVALAAMERAAAGCVRGEFSGVVTGPVGKSWLAQAGFTFPGQTEFFAARWGGEPTMAFCGGRLRVVLLTWHVPLREVFSHLTEKSLARVVGAAAELACAEGIAAPRIGVCGLNPHAGEGGLLGDEEQRVIDPILDRLRATHPGLSRCQPADTLFARALPRAPGSGQGEFDVIIALYHDQGLAPLKTLEFDEAVNVTLGLPFVRTSPDHGTAFALAGRGRASPRSFANAVAIARRLLRARNGR